MVASPPLPASASWARNRAVLAAREDAAPDVRSPPSAATAVGAVSVAPTSAAADTSATSEAAVRERAE